jgi:hypothetical protein
MFHPNSRSHVELRRTGQNSANGFERRTVSADYKSPFPFPGIVDKVEIQIAPANSCLHQWLIEEPLVRAPDGLQFGRCLSDELNPSTGCLS